MSIKVNVERSSIDLAVGPLDFTTQSAIDCAITGIAIHIDASVSPEPSRNIQVFIVDEDGNEFLYYERLASTLRDIVIVPENLKLDKSHEIKIAINQTSEQVYAFVMMESLS